MKTLGHNDAPSALVSADTAISLELELVIFTWSRFWTRSTSNSQVGSGAGRASDEPDWGSSSGQ